MDHDAVLAVNEVTVLIVITGIAIVGLIGAFIFVSAASILKGNKDSADRLR
jgi:hypothetical protein